MPTYTLEYDLYRANIRDIRNIRLDKVVVNCGIGRLVASNPQIRDRATSDVEKILGLIAGQKPSPRAIKQSIASFKIRQGETVGYAVTLRGRRMFDFISRMINLTLPRMRDFRGIPLSNVDSRGNLSIGFSEHIVFPEAANEDVRQIYSLQVVLVPSIKSRDLAIDFYRKLGIPFQKT